MSAISEENHNLVPPRDAEGRLSRRLAGEIKRKAIHLLVLAIPIGFCTMPYKIALSLVILAEIVALIFDIIRIQNRTFRLVIYRFFRDIFRHKERKSFSGAPYILFSSIFMMLVFDKWIAVVSLTYIIIGDPAAAIVGRIWGRHKIWGNKSIEGSLSFFVAAALSGLIWSLVSPIPWHFAVLGGLFAAIVEMVIYQVDDNLTVPILTALMLRFAMGT